MDPQTAMLLGGVISGGIAVKLIDIVWELVRRTLGARRGEIDRMAKQLNDAQRRAHLALAWGRRLELLAIKYGAPEDEMPVLDFKDHD